MAAYAAVVSLMNNIEQMTNHPHVSDYLDTKQIQPLLDKAGLLLDIIEGNKYGGLSKEAEVDLETQITSAAHAAEDVIESHVVDQIHNVAAAHSYVVGPSHAAATNVLYQHIQPQPVYDKETSSTFLHIKIRVIKKKVQRLMKRMLCAAHTTDPEPYTVDQIHEPAHATDPGPCTVDQIHGRSRICSLDLKQIIEDMDAIVEKAMQMKLVKEKEDEQLTHSPPLLESGETAMVGLDDELAQVMEELNGHQSNRHTISIVGMGGMGKTTLAKNIYANPFCIEHFDIRAWTTVSQQCNVEEILSQLLHSSTGDLNSGSVGELGEKLHKTLIGNRYLVILDDIWSVQAWDEVRRYLPDDGNSSRVVLTTRLSNVARVCSSSCFTMNLLDESKSWKLFCEKALFPQKEDSPQLEYVGKEIVRSCKGLALSIVLIGGLFLKSPRTLVYWESVARGLRSNPNLKEKGESLDILSLSYNHLPPHLKPCFLYMGAFKEDSETRVSDITKLWVAEGFIRPNGTRVLEEMAEDYIKDLADRNLILVITRRYNGTIGSCGIHDLLRDLCVKVAEQQDFLRVRRDGEIESRDRRITCSGYGGYNKDIESVQARSIFTRNMYSHSVKCKLVRVLSDESCYDISDINRLYGSVNLRYLAYRQLHEYPEWMWNIPGSMFSMWNLQTLMIRPNRSNPSMVAPSVIWKMRQLRHIKYINFVLPPPGDDSLVLENLQTLKTATNLILWEVCKFIPNVKKLGLLYSNNWQKDGASLIENVGNLDKLESLKIEIELRDQARAQDYALLNRTLALAVSLKKLSLSRCRLHWNDLGEMIGLLPRLQVLQLGKDSVTEGGKWSPGEGQFSQLKLLKIDRCELVCWDADSCHFPVLEKLELRQVEGLEEIPLDMGDIATLGVIRVLYCSESAAVSAVRIKEDQIENQDDDTLQIQITVARSKLRGFKEKVETEKLALAHIQLRVTG